MDLTRLTSISFASTLLAVSAHAVSIITINDIQDEVFGTLQSSFTTADYTVSSSVNSPLLVVAVAIEQFDTSVTGITFGAQNFSLASELEVPDGGNGGYVGIYYLANPIEDAATGITVTTNVATATLALSAFTLSNVNQVTPIGDTATFGDAAGAVDPSTSLTTVGNESLLISSLMSGGNIGEYSVASPGSQVTELGGGFSGVFLEVGAWEGGALGNTSSLQFDGSTGTRVVLASSEFIAIPEPSEYAFLVGLVGAGALMMRRRKS
ncbi:MAG: hypothetical protein ACQKBV_08425 [Puniceicoccales bacterium]